MIEQGKHETTMKSALAHVYWSSLRMISIAWYELTAEQSEKVRNYSFVYSEVLPESHNKIRVIRVGKEPN